MPKNHKGAVQCNPLIQGDQQDTLIYAAAVLNCLQNVDLKNGLENEAEHGFNLILEMVREALIFEAEKRIG